MRLKPHLRQALQALDLVGGEAVVEVSGRIFSRGENIPFGAVSYLRLLTRGLVEAGGPDRIRITPSGREVIR